MPMRKSRLGRKSISSLEDEIGLKVKLTLGPINCPLVMTT